MKSGERGFTLVELVVAVALIGLVSAAASSAIFQIFRGNDRNNDQITAVRQAENAGYWISRDAQMAETISTENLTSPDFLVLRWSEWADNGTAIYHSATYSFDNATDSVYKLIRVHRSSTRPSEQTLVAQYIYYDPSDTDNTSKASYENPVLTLQLTTISGKTRETREYKIKHRAGL